MIRGKITSLGCIALLFAACSTEDPKQVDDRSNVEDIAEPEKDSGDQKEDDSAALEAKGLTNNGSPLSGIEIQDGATLLPAGAQAKFKALGTYEDKSTRDLTQLVAWASSNSNKADWVDTGTLKAIAEGGSNISAKLGSYSDAKQITVFPAQLVYFEIQTPAETWPLTSGALQLVAMGRYTDGKDYDITASVDWSSDDEGIATISNDPGSEGEATGVSAGTVTFRAYSIILETEETVQVEFTN